MIFVYMNALLLCIFHLGIFQIQLMIFIAELDLCLSAFCIKNYAAVCFKAGLINFKVVFELKFKNSTAGNIKLFKLKGWNIEVL